MIITQTRKMPDVIKWDLPSSRFFFHSWLFLLCNSKQIQLLISYGSVVNGISQLSTFYTLIRYSQASPQHCNHEQYFPWEKHQPVLRGHYRCRCGFCWREAGADGTGGCAGVSSLALETLESPVLLRTPTSLFAGSPAEGLTLKSAEYTGKEKAPSAGT